MEHTSSPTASSRLSNALAQSGAPVAGAAPPATAGTAGEGGGIGALLSTLAGHAQQSLGAARHEVESNNPLAIGGLGALAGSILGGGKGAIGGGLLAALGSVAYAALQKSEATPATAGAAPSAAGKPSLGLETHEDVQSTATLLLRAMINAAKADGQIDQTEMQRILTKLQEAGSEPGAREFVISEMGKPLDLNGLVAAVKTPQQAVQVYAASLLTIDVDTPAETKYLAQLAQGLKLGPEVVAQINGAMGLKA